MGVIAILFGVLLTAGTHAQFSLNRHKKGRLLFRLLFFVGLILIAFMYLSFLLIYLTLGTYQRYQYVFLGDWNTKATLFDYIKTVSELFAICLVLGAGLYALLSRRLSRLVFYYHAVSQSRDVREVANQPDYHYEVIKRFKKGQMFFGLDQRRKPVYIPLDEWSSQHVQLLGVSGAGKGVAACQLLSQSLLHQHAVYVIDPKGDSKMPHVLKQMAEKYCLPYYFVDLNSDKAQFNLWHDLSATQIAETLISGLSLEDRGEAADFYRAKDRECAKAVANYINDDPDLSVGDMFSRFVAEHPDAHQEKSGISGFYTKLKALQVINCLNTREGIRLKSVLDQGGCIIFRGSLENDGIISLQKILMCMLMKWVKDRPRHNVRHVTVFLDELKHVLSKSVTNAFGAIRDFNANLIVAHQARGDLEDVGKDLNPKSVVGAVEINTGIKLLHRAIDPDTKRWISQMSGTIQADTTNQSNTTGVGRNASRTIHQGKEEQPLISENEVAHLPNKTAVLIGTGLARVVKTAYIAVDTTESLPIVEAPVNQATPVQADSI